MSSERDGPSRDYPAGPRLRSPGTPHPSPSRLDQSRPTLRRRTGRGPRASGQAAARWRSAHGYVTARDSLKIANSGTANHPRGTRAASSSPTQRRGLIERAWPAKGQTYAATASGAAGQASECCAGYTPTTGSRHSNEPTSGDLILDVLKAATEYTRATMGPSKWRDEWSTSPLATARRPAPGTGSTEPVTRNRREFVAASTSAPRGAAKHQSHKMPVRWSTKSASTTTVSVKHSADLQREPMASGTQANRSDGRATTAEQEWSAFSAFSNDVAATSGSAGEMTVESPSDDEAPNWREGTNDDPERSRNGEPKATPCGDPKWSRSSCSRSSRTEATPILRTGT